MGNLPKIGQPKKIPIVLSTPDYMMDHHFQGKPVLPAVEAMEALTRVAKETYLRLQPNHLVEIRFEKFLFLDPHSDHIEGIVELTPLEKGRLQATLLTSTKSPKAAFTRTKVHVSQIFDSSPPPELRRPLDMAAALKGICTTVPPEKIYRALVPFGPTFRNIQAPLFISPDGAMARIQTPRQKFHTNSAAGHLGSGYALDAAFHAACVWAQHYKGVVAFPVAVDRRTITVPTQSEKTYIGRIIPRDISDTLMIFDILLLDSNGRICETAEGVHMRDVSGGRLQPPDWIGAKDKPDPLDNLRKTCRDMVVLELDAVADIARKALTPREVKRFQKMSERRRKSFLAARIALKSLYRRLREEEDEGAMPADRIDTVRENSPLPCIGPMDSTEKNYCSVSHDRRFAVAVSDSRAVGVDVEVISSKALKAGRIFMSTAEQNLVKQSTMRDLEAAVRIWSAKEAVAKATGFNLADTWERVRVTDVYEDKSELNVDGNKLMARHAMVAEHLFTLVSI